ncbi:hypothetical protein HDU83_003185 [Entophlyctis luteolus]|nr:hypothetical protein HDU83_003185 [Entophlyctis luteolus]
MGAAKAKAEVDFRFPLTDGGFLAATACLAAPSSSGDPESGGVQSLDDGLGRPIAIVCHGIKGLSVLQHASNPLNPTIAHKNNPPLLARISSDLHISSVRFDFRGAGDSTGDVLKMTDYRRCADDIRHVHAWLSSHGWRVVCIMGHSMGSMAALLFLVDSLSASASPPPPLPPLFVNICGRFSFKSGLAAKLVAEGLLSADQVHDALTHQRDSDESLGDTTLFTVNGWWGGATGLDGQRLKGRAVPYVLSLQKALQLWEEMDEAIQQAKTILPPSLRTLTVHGDCDEIVPVESATLFAQVLPGNTVSLVEGGNHNLNSKRVTDRGEEDHASLASSVICEWVRKNGSLFSKMAPPPFSPQPPPPVDTVLSESYVASHRCLKVTIVRQWIITNIRSGETEMSKVKKGGRYYEGHLDTSLTETGRLQAKALAYRLRKQKIDHIFTSDLKRCVETTDEIEKYHDNVPVSIDIRLREQNLSDLAGKRVPEVQKILKESDNHFNGYLKKHGGETTEALKARVLEFYSDIIIEQLVVPHNKFLYSLGIFSPTFSSPISSKPSQDHSVEEPDSLHHEYPIGERPNRRNLPHVQTNNLMPSSVPATFSAQSTISNPPHPLLTPTVGASTPSTTTTATATSPLKAPQTTAQQNPRRPRFPLRHIVVVTHAGPLNALLRHLAVDLAFPALYPQPPHRTFPKCAAISAFAIDKSFWRSGDYEWRGAVLAANDVSHLAMLVEKWSDDVHKRDAARKRRGKLPPQGTAASSNSRQTATEESAGNAFSVDKSSWYDPTPQSSPEKTDPPCSDCAVNSVPKRSLGW